MNNDHTWGTAQDFGISCLHQQDTMVNLYHDNLREIFELHGTLQGPILTFIMQGLLGLKKKHNYVSTSLNHCTLLLNLGTV